MTSSPADGNVLSRWETEFQSAVARDLFAGRWETDGKRKNALFQSAVARRAGLGTYVHDSGQTQHQGPISKRGRSELRHAVVEAAWVAVEHSDFWRAEFARLCRRKHKGVASVAIARRMLVAVWHVLTKHQPDQHADDAKVAKKFRRWSSRMRKPSRRGQSIVAFTRSELDRVGLGAQIDQIPNGNGKPFILPPSMQIPVTS